MSILINADQQTCDLSQWDSVTETGGGVIEATSDGSLAGAPCGVAITVSSGQVANTRSTVSPSGDSLRLRFYIDPNDFAMGNFETFNLLVGGTPLTFVMWLGWTDANGYNIQAAGYEDADTSTTFANINITNEPHMLEFLATRASSAVASDGSYELWLDGVSVATLTGQDIFDDWPPTVFDFGAGIVTGKQMPRS